MDKLYTGDIPSEYHYAVFGNNYIDLYNTDVLYNNTYTYYRLYTNQNGFYYSVNTTTYNQFITTYATDIETTNDFFYRNDFANIIFVVFAFVLFGIFLFNIMTSIIRKGGLLGGLL